MALVQSAANATAKQGPGGSGSTSVKATFTTPTTSGSYLLAIVVTAGGVGITHSLSSGAWSVLWDDAIGDVQVSVWGRANAPATSSLTAYADAYRGMTVRLLEYSGIAQASALDRVADRVGESSAPTSGATSTTTRPDETVVAVVVNQYASTTQSGFSGGLTKLYEDVTPDGGTQDWERSRTTVHQRNVSATGTFSVGAALPTSRKWIAGIVTLKGGTTGPAKLYSLAQPPLYTVGGNRGSNLTVFGRLRSAAQPVLYVAGIGVRSRIGPANYQMRLGGWSGLLIGAGTDHAIEEIDGLEGWDVRVSDEDLPRDAGSLRGTDLQAARQILVKVNWAGTRTQIETLADALKRALVPQRDQDQELLYRLPGQPLKSVYCRPITVPRGLTPDKALLASETFILRAADPRHYAATISTVTVPITTNRNSPMLATVYNLGSAEAFPVIRILGPSSGAASRVTLTNVTTTGVFDAVAVLGPSSTLVGDMRSRVAGLPVSAVTIDGAAKYGAWQPPRIPFALAPGVNQLMFEVEPAGTAVTCSLEWRSTWSG